MVGVDVRGGGATVLYVERVIVGDKDVVEDAWVAFRWKIATPRPQFVCVQMLQEAAEAQAPVLCQGEKFLAVFVDGVGPDSVGDLGVEVAEQEYPCGAGVV